MVQTEASFNKKRRGRPRIPSQAVERVLELHHLDKSPKEITRTVNLEGHPISYNSVRNIIARDAPPDPSAPWRLEPREGIGRAYPNLVLPALAAIRVTTERRVNQITEREADWLVAIRQAGPLLAAWTCYELARRYRSFELQDRDTQPLDVGLAQLIWMLEQPRIDLRDSFGLDDVQLEGFFKRLIVMDAAATDGLAVRVVPAVTTSE